jgi:hypothetical protein
MNNVAKPELQENSWLAAVLDEPSSWAEISEDLLAEQSQRVAARQAAGIVEPADHHVRCTVCGQLFRDHKSEKGTATDCGCYKAADPAMPISKFTASEALDMVVWFGEIYGWPSDVQSEVAP